MKNIGNFASKQVSKIGMKKIIGGGGTPTIDETDSVIIKFIIIPKKG